jgi:hypothetical protein
MTDKYDSLDIEWPVAHGNALDKWPRSGQVRINCGLLTIRTLVDKLLNINNLYMEPTTGLEPVTC